MGAAGFAADHRGQPAALAAAGIELPLLEVDGSEAAPQLGAEERALVAAAVAADVAADSALRDALLEGLSLFVSGALLAQQLGQPVTASSEAELASVLQLLRSKLQAAAEMAAAAAAALLQTRVAQPTEGGEDGSAAAAAGGQEPQGVLVPVVQLTWGDEAADGRLPAALPAALMQYPSCRQLQLQLLALQDAQLSANQLHLLASGSLLSLLLAQAQPVRAQQAIEQLRLLIAAMSGGGGASSVADVAVYQLLLWLLEAGQPQAGNAAGDAGGEWQQLLQRSLVHEAWYRWQRGLWTGAAAALPSPHASSLASAAQQQWAAAAAGPLRLHIAAGTVLASTVTAAPATLIADRSARLLQLKLAARQLRSAACSGGSDAASTAGVAAAAEWQAAAALAAATLAAHLGSVPDQELQQQLKVALAWLASERCTGGAVATAQQGDQDAQLLQLASKALGSSSHPVLRNLAHPVLLPALQGLLLGSAEAATASPRGENGCVRGSIAGICSTLLPFLTSHLVMSSLSPLQRACWRVAACGRCWPWHACTC